MLLKLLLFVLFVSPSFSIRGRITRWHGKLSTRRDATLTASCAISTTARDNPWAVILYWDNAFVCGGTLLEADLVVTAAHCVVGKRTDFFTVYYGTTYRPDAGIPDQGARDSGGHSKVAEIRIHPNYDLERKFEGNDLAVLRLRKRVTFNDRVKPIAVAPYNAKYDALWKDGTNIQLAGLGQISGPIHSLDVEDYPDQLQLIRHRVVPQQRCNRGNTTNRLGPSRDILCTRGMCEKIKKVKLFQQICPGDSGSGLVGYFQPENRYFLVAVASFIISPSDTDCGKSTKPAFNILARFHRDFIYGDFPSTYTESVDCSWGRWTAWSACSSTCGAGKKIRRRGKEKVASHGGRSCSGVSFEEAECNIIPCRSGKTSIEENEQICSRGLTCETKDTCPYIASKYQEIRNLGNGVLNKTKRRAIVNQLKSAICNKQQKAFCCPKLDSNGLPFSSFESNALGCLANLGYINPFLTTDSANAKQTFHCHLRTFQELVGLEVTGEVDTDTRDVMALTRCGIGIDEEPLISNNITIPHWDYKILTYRILKYSSKLSKTEIDRTIRQAMDLWEGSADIKFILTPGNPDIEIIFATGDHGDELPFDGEEGSLAHGYYPSSEAIGGDLHVDDDEPWSVTPHIGKQLLRSVAHELGHSLGLSHSRVRESVMYFAFPEWNPNLKLHQDDIDSIQEIYGPPSKPRSKPPVISLEELNGPC